MLEQPPPPSWRKPAGVLAICGLILCWCILVANLATSINRLPALAQVPVYLVLGLVWIAPLKPLLRWMER